AQLSSLKSQVSSLRHEAQDKRQLSTSQKHARGDVYLRSSAADVPRVLPYATLSAAGLSGTGTVAGAVAPSLRGRAGPTRLAFFHLAVRSESPLIAWR